MIDDSDLLDLVVERLVLLRIRLGGRAYRDAAQRALTGIARAALEEGKRRAARGDRRPEHGCSVIDFPPGGRAGADSER